VKYTIQCAKNFGPHDEVVEDSSVKTPHVQTRPNTPRINGKPERFIQTLMPEWA